MMTAAGWSDGYLGDVGAWGMRRIGLVIPGINKYTAAPPEDKQASLLGAMLRHVVGLYREGTVPARMGSSTVTSTTFFTHTLSLD